MHRKFRFFTFLLFTLLPLAASAENITAVYEGEWGGMKVGRMTITASENNNAYEYMVKLDSLGLLKTFSKYRSENTAKGKLVNGDPLPTRYFTEWWRKKKEHQQIEVTYKNGGKIVEEIATPPEKRPKRPIVPPEYKNETLDPVSAAFYARKHIKELVEAGVSYPQKFTIPVFDARRRFDAEVTINGYKKKNYNGKNQNLLEVIYSRTPVNGFNDKELLRMKQQDPTITFYMNDSYIPVRGSGEAPFGRANFELVSLSKQ